MRFATTRMTTRMTMNSTMRFGRRTSTRRDGARSSRDDSRTFRRTIRVPGPAIRASSTRAVASRGRARVLVAAFTPRRSATRRRTFRFGRRRFFSSARARGASAALADGCLLGAFVSPETFVSALASRLASALAPASILTFFAFAFALAFARALASSAFARVSSASIAATAAMAASTSAASAASAASASASSANMARSPVAGSTRSGTYHPETRARARPATLALPPPGRYPSTTAISPPRASERAASPSRPRVDLNPTPTVPAGMHRRARRVRRTPRFRAVRASTRRGKVPPRPLGRSRRGRRRDALRRVPRRAARRRRRPPSGGGRRFCRFTRLSRLNISKRERRTRGVVLARAGEIPPSRRRVRGGRVSRLSSRTPVVGVVRVFVPRSRPAPTAREGRLERAGEEQR